ncbi:MAG: NlpC/P60 family protein [Chitinophagia bacterium]|jgi:lipoprotein Spr|nr:NlpC/P60 family protein [Chitinophagia bacterium]
MKLEVGKYFLGACFMIAFLSSCSALKSISVPNNSIFGKTNVTSTKQPRKMEFLDDISVTPGKITINNASDAVETEKPAPISKNYEMMPSNLSEVEKANWLQLKYSIKMDIAVEEIKNIPLLQKIDEWWGTPYVLGGNSKNGVDCSYFTLDVMKDIYKVNLKRTAAEQYEQSFKIEWNDLKEGDLIFFKTEGRRRISHVGIYIANNKFAHASTSQGVTIGDLTDPYWQRRLYSLGRVNPSL